MHTHLPGSWKCSLRNACSCCLLGGRCAQADMAAFTSSTLVLITISTIVLESSYSACRRTYSTFPFNVLESIITRIWGITVYTHIGVS